MEATETASEMRIDSYGIRLRLQQLDTNSWLPLASVQIVAIDWTPGRVQLHLADERTFCVAWDEPETVEL